MYQPRDVEEREHRQDFPVGGCRYGDDLQCLRDDVAVRYLYCFGQPRGAAREGEEGAYLAVAFPCRDSEGGCGRAARVALCDELRERGVTW